MKKALLTILIMCYPTISIAANGLVSERNLAKIEQLPIACINDNYTILGYSKIQACFPSTLGNRVTDLVVKGMAVQQFNSLNWPVEEGRVGMPSSRLKKEESDVYPVWQSWMTLNDFYLFTNKEESSWFDSTSHIPKSCEKFIAKNKAGTTALARFLKRNENVPYGPKIQVLTVDKTASNNKIYDAQGQALKFQIYINNVAYQSMLKYEAKIATGGVKFKSAVSGGSVIGPNNERGSILIKAAWKILNEDKRKIHRALAFIVDEEDTTKCELSVVGLVGLHIANASIPTVMKDNKKELIASADPHNLWTWTTYEYKNNAPNITEFNHDKYREENWLFFDLSLNKDTLAQGCDKDKEGVKLVNHDPHSNSRCAINNPKMNPSVILSNDYGDLVNNYKAINSGDSVWDNYRVIGSQWSEGGKLNVSTKLPSGPDKTGLVNNVLEPFLPEEGCVQCHSKNRELKSGRFKNDLMFLNNKINNKENWIDFDLLMMKER